MLTQVKDKEPSEVSSSPSFSHVAKAKQHESQNEFLEAFTHAKLALSDAPDDKEIIEYMRHLIISARSNHKSPLITLLDVITNTTNSEKSKNDAMKQIRILINTTSGLSAESHSVEAIALEFVHAKSIGPEYEESMLLVIKDLCRTKEYARIISYYYAIESGFISQRLYFRNEVIYGLNVDILILLFNIDHSDSNFTGYTSKQLKTTKNSIGIYDAFFQSLANISILPEQSQTKLFLAISHILGQKEISHLFSNNENHVHTLLKSTLMESSRGLLAAALARVYDNFGDKESTISIEFYKNFLMRNLGSVKLAERTVALTALHCISQALPVIGHKLFQLDGMIEELRDTLEDEVENIQSIILQFLSDMSNDAVMKKRVLEEFGEIIKSHSKFHKSSSVQALANALFIKLTASPKTKLNSKNAQPEVLKPLSNIEEAQQIDIFIKSLSVIDQNPSTLSSTVEALVYLSATPANKEILCKTECLKSFVQFCMKASTQYQYGLAAVFLNLTDYIKKLSDEEEQIKKLKELSGDSQKMEQDPLNDDAHVDMRCLQVLKNGIVIVLNHFTKNESPAMKEIVCNLFLNISRNQKHRGHIIQQGGVKSLMELTKTSEESSLLAAQALAKIAITTDPNIAFNNQRATELVGPFIALVNGHNELQQFEGLMALTNLASMGGQVRDKIVHLKGMRAMENSQISDNFMIQRAATGALCNMMYDEKVYDAYVKNVSVDGVRLRIFLAFCDAEDYETRIAASGALTVLTTNEDVCEAICKDGIGLKNIIKLVEEDSDDLVHRGVECLKNICKFGKFGKYIVANDGLVGLQVLMEHDNQAISRTAAEALSCLFQCGVLKK